MRRTRPYDREFAIPLVKNTFIRVGFDLKYGQILDMILHTGDRT